MLRNCRDLTSNFSHIMPMHFSNFNLEKGQKCVYTEVRGSNDFTVIGLCTLGDVTFPEETTSKNLVFHFLFLGLGRYWSWN